MARNYIPNNNVYFSDNKPKEFEENTEENNGYFVFT